ncbi:peptidoglycan/xylan/chitin deacetylase (PgdA/CDA1 family) [Stackebrandtia albiflava]|uniref:Peptidoglycan/xylan/chitin deacetylase (PgdA/CDA1 family) n=1 Tax=Stackebrandtia albiflava TaxID=406432 RepID=A0A562V111_9ACTN|nr:polysaccharide deacetylase family protein [Stackebrandtia albiflava]TWJ11568.1 peptidoglycan/xylan/chitin deacetylase (PgdA/CDA1 family) [Stackebrandtia albiflava]
MKRFVVVAVVVALIVVAGVGGYLLLRETPGAHSSAASEPSPVTVTTAPASPVPPPSPSPTESPEPVAVVPDESWSGPSGSMAVTGSDAVALTFDDGPSPAWTPHVLNTLRDWQVKATFCVVGTEVRANPELVKAIVADGHTLCNHSWHHETRLGHESATKIRRNLERTNDAIRDIVPDAYIGYYRQPGGQWTERVVRIAMEMGMVPLHWSVDPSDWDKSTRSSHIERNVLGHTSAGSIILMHDGGGDRRRTSDALGPILSELTSRFRLIALP